MEEKLLFIIGSPRSGSTLLSRMLGSHSAIFSPAEPHLLTPLANLGYSESVDNSGDRSRGRGPPARVLACGHA